MCFEIVYTQNISVPFLKMETYKVEIEGKDKMGCGPLTPYK